MNKKIKDIIAEDEEVTVEGVSDYVVESSSCGAMLIELRKKTGMSRKAFAEYFQIPYRTMQDWELGNRTMPDYLYRLMAYKVEIEKLKK